MYHKLSIEETLKSLDVNPENGLSDKEAFSRLASDLRPKHNSSFFKFAAVGISRPIVWLLLICAVLSSFCSYNQFLKIQHYSSPSNIFLSLANPL